MYPIDLAVSVTRSLLSAALVVAAFAGLGIELARAQLKAKPTQSSKLADMPPPVRAEIELIADGTDAGKRATAITSLLQLGPIPAPSPRVVAQSHRPPATKGGRVDSERVAQAMVKAWKDTRGMGERDALRTTLEGDEKMAIRGAVSKALDAALATTGETVDNVGKFQLILALDGWFLARRPLSPEALAQYQARFSKIDKGTIDAWRTAWSKSDKVSNSPTLILAALAFQDFLFNGGEWRKGNPERALARLGSLTPDAASRWKEVAKGSWASWALLAVDDLFVNDSFQPVVFDAALPIAQRMLATP